MPRSALPHEARQIADLFADVELDELIAILEPVATLVVAAQD